MARKHALKLRELRTIRLRFIIILGGMAAVTVLILAYLGIRVFVLTREKLGYLDFAGFCFYGFASVVMTIAQIIFLRQLNVGSGPRIEELTNTDDLTGLANRRHIARFLAEEFREAQLSKNPLALLFLDLDGFKAINDQHGHDAGDLVLRAVAHAIKESVREADCVGRVGGDEFMIVLPDTDSQCASVVAHRIAQRLISICVTVDRPDPERPSVLRELTASIGISSYPANANVRTDLVKDADVAMYAAKNSGKGHIVVSISHPKGPEPRSSAAHITTLESQIGDVVKQPPKEPTDA